MKDFFELAKRKTTVKTEVIAGLTTFLSMSYILIVNPLILGDAGMDKGAVFTATIVAAFIGTMIMGLYANFPVALAPGMGMNAFFTYSVVLTLGYSWQEALFGVFVSGIIFILISFTGLREKIINAIPLSLKYATSSGIGFFIAFIGLQNSEIIVKSDATLVTFGEITNPSVYLTLLGVVIMLYFHAKKNNFAIIIAMTIVAIVGYGLQSLGINTNSTIPSQIISQPPSIQPLFGKIFTDVNAFKLLTDITFITVVFSLLFVDFFDTAGTLVAVGSEANLIDQKGKIKDANKALICDATATTLGAVVGTSSTTTYIESLAGIKSGGRSGLTAVVVAGLFILSLFFAPIFTSLGVYVTAPALIMVGILMAQNQAKINYNDFASVAGAFFTTLIMIVSYSIAQGIAFGFLAYTLVKVFEGKYKEIDPIIYGLDIIFILYFLNM